MQAATFTSNVLDRQPVDHLGTVPTALERLWYFTHLRDLAGHTVVHRWFFNDQPVARVRLPVRGDDWRTWSAKYTGERRDGTWRVEVWLDEDCILLTDVTGERVEDVNVDLDGIDRQLEAGDLAGAQMAIDQALSMPGVTPAQRQRLRQRRDQDLVLARVRRALSEKRLYVAGARLDTLADQPLTAENRAALEALKRAFTREKERLDSDAGRRLGALEHALNNTLLGGHVCPVDDATLDRWLSLTGLTPHLLASDSQTRPHGQQWRWLDRRTGSLHSLSLTCPPRAPVTGD